MVQPPKFELDGIETNNTIPAEQIGEWSGEWISAYKRRQAGEVIQATTIDERITPPAKEGEKTLIQKIGELPVIKQIVGAVKAVGKFFKKLFSDSRLKTDIVKVGQVEDINIYKFKFIYDKSKTQIGVIAQEVNEIVPEVVTYASDVDEYGVAYGNFAGLFIEGFKEQQNIINKQSDEINLLKQELQKIKDLILNINK